MKHKGQQERDNMTRKDYEAIAKAINATMGDAPEDHDKKVSWQRGLAHLVGRLEQVFAADNPNFDQSKFAKACGLRF